VRSVTKGCSLPLVKPGMPPKASRRRRPKRAAVSDYLAHEGLEHAEQAREHLESAPHHPFLRGVPLVAAILAVCAGLSSLYGNRLGEAMLIQGNEAVLDQAAASDKWNEYQAESLKAHIAGSIGQLGRSSEVKQLFLQSQEEYRKRQPPLQADAKRLEQAESDTIARVDRIEGKKLYFDVATALFQISIVLASISAMTRRPPLFIVALIGGSIGLASCVVGFLR
jgi:hypothetical protein